MRASALSPFFFSSLLFLSKRKSPHAPAGRERARVTWGVAEEDTNNMNSSVYFYSRFNVLHLVRQGAWNSKVSLGHGPQALALSLGRGQDPPTEGWLPPTQFPGTRSPGCGVEIPSPHVSSATGPSDALPDGPLTRRLLCVLGFHLRLALGRWSHSGLFRARSELRSPHSVGLVDLDGVRRWCSREGDGRMFWKGLEHGSTG